jgi:hypothetical protein
MAVVSLFVSRSLPSNGSMCHNILTQPNGDGSYCRFISLLLILANASLHSKYQSLVVTIPLNNLKKCENSKKNNLYLPFSYFHLKTFHSSSTVTVDVVISVIVLTFFV